MEGYLKEKSNIKDYQWQDIVEILSVLGSIGGSIASVVTHQVVFASIPLSLSVTLNLVNRRQLLDSIHQSNQTAITQLREESREQSTETRVRLGTLTEQLADVQQLTTDLGQGHSSLENYTTQLGKESEETQVKLGTLSEQLVEVQQLTTDLDQGNSNLQDYTQSLHQEQKKIADLLSCLREIETCTQTIRINPNYAEAYYNRGIAYQNLGEKQGAIGDYTEAIRINPSYADAYYNRGLIYADLGDKKGGVEDLREAAKFFFEEGDIASYQKARDLSKNFHELSSQSTTDAFEAVAVGRLFF